jgi:hypothetical protein
MVRGSVPNLTTCGSTGVSATPVRWYTRTPTTMAPGTPMIRSAATPNGSHPRIDLLAHIASSMPLNMTTNTTFGANQRERRKGVPVTAQGRTPARKQSRPQVTARGRGRAHAVFRTLGAGDPRTGRTAFPHRGAPVAQAPDASNLEGFALDQCRWRQPTTAAPDAASHPAVPLCGDQLAEVSSRGVHVLSHPAA